eukprot:926710-Alexandrium_andersonii.AAC.1
MLDAKAFARSSPQNSPDVTERHYQGGQFLPGGGRAPVGGAVVAAYKGGQFLPGGGRAPAGGCEVVKARDNPATQKQSTEVSSGPRTARSERDSGGSSHPAPSGGGGSSAVR